MAIEIMNNYNNVYESTYAAQKQQASKQQAASKTEAKGTDNSSKSKSTAEYMNELSKLVPSVKCRVGNTFASGKTGKTLTINPLLLEKMQNDPEKEKEMKELIKGVESMTKLSESINKATGWTIVYQHNYIDENGKFHHVGQYRNDFMLNMSDKLREERRKKADELIEKAKEKAAEKKEELQEAQEQPEEKEIEEDKKIGKAEKIIKEKIADSEDGMIYMNDEELKEIMEAMKEDNVDTNKANAKGQSAVGANFDLQI